MTRGGKMFATTPYKRVEYHCKDYKHAFSFQLEAIEDYSYDKSSLIKVLLY